MGDKGGWGLFRIIEMRCLTRRFTLTLDLSSQFLRTLNLYCLGLAMGPPQQRRAPGPRGPSLNRLTQLVALTLNSYLLRTPFMFSIYPKLIFFVLVQGDPLRA